MPGRITAGWPPHATAKGVGGLGIIAEHIGVICMGILRNVSAVGVRIFECTMEMVLPEFC